VQWHARCMKYDKKNDCRGVIVHKPVVTVGVPAYNAEKYLVPALESLLNQTLTDFELVISDNASTDGTAAICQEFANADPRVSYIRQPKNLGGPRNWNFLAAHASAPYFKWAAANDVCAPTLIERGVAALEANPGAVLAHGDSALIDSEGEEIERYADPLDAGAGDAAYRFQRVLETLGLNNAQNGVIRRTGLARTHLEGIYSAGDVTFVAELALFGRFVKIPELLFYRRVAADASTLGMSAADIGEFNNPGARRRRSQDTLAQSIDLVRRVWTSPLGYRDRLRLSTYLLRRLYWERNALWAELWPWQTGRQP